MIWSVTKASIKLTVPIYFVVMHFDRLLQVTFLLLWVTGCYTYTSDLEMEDDIIFLTVLLLNVLCSCSFIDFKCLFFFTFNRVTIILIIQRNHVRAIVHSAIEVALIALGESYDFICNTLRVFTEMTDYLKNIYCVQVICF